MYLCRNLSSINWLPLKLACDCNADLYLTRVVNLACVLLVFQMVNKG